MDDWSPLYPEEVRRPPNPVFQRRAFRIAVGIPAAFFLFGGFHGMFTDYKTMQEVRRRAQARTEHVQAVIVETHVTVSRGGEVHADGAGTISFTTASGRQIQKRYGGYRGKPGGSVPLTYDPGDPDNFSFGGDEFGISDILINNVFSFLVGGALLAACLFVDVNRS